jgi:cell division protein FtsQ
MPLEMEDADEGGSSQVGGGVTGGARFGGSRQASVRNPWWRPANGAGRVFLAIAALIVLGGLAASAHLFKALIERDAHFRITGTGNIEAAGLNEVSRAQLLPVFGEDIGRNIFFVPLAERRTHLEEIPWIERATVMRLLPNRIRVTVVERQPVAFVRQGQQIGLVDANGVLLTMPVAMMSQNHYSFPVVTGIDAGDSLASRKERMAVYQRLLAELDANGHKFSQQISEIDLTDPEDAKVLMPEPGGDVLAHFGRDHFLERYRRYKAHIKEWRQQYPRLMAVDLRYPQQVVLEMNPGSDGSQGAAGGQTAGGADAQPDKTPGANPAGNVPGKTKAKLTPASSHAKSEKPAAKDKLVKVAGKTDGKTSAKRKTAHEKVLLKARESVKDKAREKKRAAVRRAALNASKRKTAPTFSPAPTAGQGE